MRVNIFLRKIHLFIVPILFLVTVCDIGAKNNISVKTFPLIDQLPSNTVKRILQDSDGYMWFGTLDGLCRYDGYRVITFRSDINNPDLLIENEISCLEEDHNNNIWIGTIRGINILNKKNYHIYHFNNEYINNKEVRCIKVAQDGKIWIGIAGGIFCFNPDFSLKKKFNGTPNAIYEDRENNIWITLNNNGLFKYDKTTDSLKKYPSIGKRNNPFCIFQDNKMQFWVGTWGDGLFLFDPQKPESEMFTPVNILNKEKKVKENIFFSIIQDDINGYIWAISLSGLYALQQKEDGTITEKNISQLFSNSNNIFSEIIKDKNGNLWIGAYSEGIINIDFDRPVVKNVNLSQVKQLTGIKPNVTNIYRDKKGVIWFNQNRWGAGLYFPDGKIKMYNEFLIPEKIIDFICIADFCSLPDEMWLSSHYSSIIYSMKQGQTSDDLKINYEIDLTDIVPNPGNIQKFYEDKNKNIWIITSHGIFVKPYQQEVKSYLTGGETIYDLTEDSEGYIWISCKNEGLLKLSIADGFVKAHSIRYSKSNSQLASNKITAICGVGNQLWIGTQEGYIIVYDKDSDTFKDMSASFKMIQESVYNINKDNIGSIWISTNKKIIQYHPASGTLRDYSMTDGLSVNSFLRNSCYTDRDGNLLFGGNGGISLFTPVAGLTEQNHNDSTYITDIKVNNKSLLRNNSLDLDLNNNKIIFDPNDKNIEIHFSSLNYSFSSKVRYAYKMEGVDDDWVYTEYNRQFAFYNQLGKGSHTFLIRATNENGLWNDEITKFVIYKRPAFYETWWAYMLYMLLVITTIYYTYTRVRNRIKLRNELKIAQIEKDKAEELTQVKLRYFTNISHDFLTPLTIISCLVDDIEMTVDKKLKQFDLMRSNIDRLKRLLQQILDFRKVESGNMKLKLSQGDIVKFIREGCYTNFEPLMKKKNIDLKFETSSKAITAYFDMDKIDKIVFNLLSNAYKYTPSGGSVEVELTENKTEENTTVTIKIKDTGIGISKEDQKNIFTRFYNNMTKYAGETNGIGLSLAKDLVQLHCGSIEVESILDCGSTFIINIPTSIDSYSESDISSSDMNINNHDTIDIMSLNTEDNKKTDVNDSPENKTLLLVEDNIELLALMRNILSHEFNIEVAENGEEALAMIKKKNIDIIISDVMMPKMDGLELCRTLKNDIESSHIPIILLTAKNSIDDRIECYNSGADGYISKPFELKLLKARINSFIQNKKEKQKSFKLNFETDLTSLDVPSIDEQFIKNVISIIEEHISESELDVNILAQKLNMSKSTLYRKIKNLTDLSPSDFIRNIKLKRACILLKGKLVNISEVAYQCGFSDPKYFTHCFKNEFGTTPSEYQKKYSE